MPQNLSTSLRGETGFSILQAELLAEQAAALGRLGRDLERALAALAETGADASDEDILIRSAAHAAWAFFVQREACGLHDHDLPIAHYAIPPKVLARVGAR
jgi:type II secretory pathway component PulJ